MKVRAGLVVFAFIFGATVKTGCGLDLRYWVWQRDDPLDDTEIAELAAQKVQTIYWQVGEIENNGETWHWKARFHFPAADEGGIHFVPSVRLVSREDRPFSGGSVANLLTRLAPVVRDADELQLDYDAPDRLLPDYSAALNQIHQVAHKVTITALPHWSRPDYLPMLQQSVDELLPMLYDFEAEPVLKDDSPLPLIAPEKIWKLIQDWRHCGKTWRAGLPVFARLSVYGSNRKLRGQIRNWNWDEVCFHPGFQLVRRSEFGTSLLLATKQTTVANTAIKPGEQLVVREADRSLLRDAIAAAERAGAQSVVLFRLPDSSASSGWSLHQLGHLDAQPRLLAQYAADTQSLELVNSGDGDLEPRFGSKTPGYALELESDAAIWREAHPGDFAGLTSLAGDKLSAIPFATWLQFRFSQIRAHQKITTGLIQLAPGADFRQARYRIIKPEGASPWQPLQSKPE